MDNTDVLVCGTYRLELTRAQVMGVINVTPDSFSDGGDLYRAGRLDIGAVRAHAMQLVHEGAAVLDIGGESTRPGATSISGAEERSRVLPVIAALADLGVPLSVDTSDPDLMSAAIDLGVAMINDVRALSRPGALAAVAGSRVGVCLMHMQGVPEHMQRAPVYADVVTEVRDFLAERVAYCRDAGIDAQRMLIDPGFGFGKSLEHNLTLLRRLRELCALGPPLLVGLSRKGTIGLVTGQSDARLRLAGSLAAAVLAAQAGAKLIRVHDVRATVDALQVVYAVADAH